MDAVNTTVLFVLSGSFWAPLAVPVSVTVPEPCVVNVTVRVAVDPGSNVPIEQSALEAAIRQVPCVIESELIWSFFVVALQESLSLTEDAVDGPPL